MKNEYDMDMIWKLFIEEHRYQICSARRFHQAVRRIFKGLR